MNLQEKVNHLNHGMYQPTFKPTNTNVTVGPGDRAVLRCRVENLGTKTVSAIRKINSSCLYAWMKEMLICIAPFNNGSHMYTIPI